MKYKRLGLIVAFCFVSWLVLALVIFSDNLSKKIDVEVNFNVFKPLKQNLYLAFLLHRQGRVLF